MFDWLFGKPFQGNSGIEKIRNDFIQMLQTAQKEFELACQVTLHGEDPALVKEKLLNYDKSVNKAERSIRKELVVHCAVRGTIETECLAMMSISKDAERLGDYSKNIFDLGELAPCLPEGKEREELLVLEKLVLKNFTECSETIHSQNSEMAEKLIIDCKWAEHQCDSITKELLNLPEPTRRTASDVLMFRFMKRMMSHLRNISSSVVQPLHKLDFTKKITKSVEMNGTLLDHKAELGIK
jgi:phosphate uptake regulator